MKKRFLYFVAIVCGMMTLCGCAKDVLNQEENEEAAPSSVLHVFTRTGDEGGDTPNANVPEPVCLYVFNTQGSCVRVIPDMSSLSDIRLPGGTYNIYGIAGADATRYLMPESDEAGIDSEIALREGQSFADLMTSHESVTMSSGGEQSLTLTMRRVVFNIRRIAIKQIPETVTAVSVTISPLYEKLLINGDYSGEDGSCEITLTEEEDGTTWSIGSADEGTDIFLLPSVGNPVITINVTTSEGTKNYSYQSNGELTANHKVTIEGTYTEQATLTFDGTVTGEEWDSDQTVSFDFDENSTQSADSGSSDPDDPDDPDDPNDPDDPTPVTLPAVGTLYQTCYVLAHVDANHVLLMAPKAEANKVATVDNNDTTKEEINAELATWNINGITGWECPDKSNAELIAYKDKDKDITNKIKIVTGLGDGCFYEDSNGTIKGFRSNSSGALSDVTISNRTRVIGVATVEITN